MVKTSSAPAISAPGEHPSDYCGPCKSGNHAACYAPCLCRDRSHVTGPVNDLEEAMSAAAAERDSWVDAEIRRVAPALADVPEQTARFLSNVQSMLVAGSGIEAARFAAEVAREAQTVALMRVEYMRLRADLMARAPLRLRMTVAT